LDQKQLYDALSEAGLFIDMLNLLRVPLDSWLVAFRGLEQLSGGGGCEKVAYMLGDLFPAFLVKLVST
jgi:hypothetical protein